MPPEVKRQPVSASVKSQRPRMQSITRFPDALGRCTPLALAPSPQIFTRKVYQPHRQDSLERMKTKRRSSRSMSAWKTCTRSRVDLTLDWSSLMDCECYVVFGRLEYVLIKNMLSFRTKPITDRRGRIAGMYLVNNAPDWAQKVESATQLLASLGPQCSPAAQNTIHRQGTFGYLSTGISQGNGSTVRSFLAQGTPSLLTTIFRSLTTWVTTRQTLKCCQSYWQMLSSFNYRVSSTQLLLLGLQFSTLTTWTTCANSKPGTPYSCAPSSIAYLLPSQSTSVPGRCASGIETALIYRTDGALLQHLGGLTGRKAATLFCGT